MDVVFLMSGDRSLNPARLLIAQSVMSQVGGSFRHQLYCLVYSD